MTRQIFYADFKDLRQAYNEVKSFVEAETYDKVLSLDTKLVEDLGCAGDDNWELLEKFVIKYELGTTGSDYSKHFLSEGELFNSGEALLNLIKFSVIIALWIIRILSFGKIDWTQKQIFPNWHKITSDLTFGDMLTWYLTREYNLREDVWVRLRNAT